MDDQRIIEEMARLECIDIIRCNKKMKPSQDGNHLGMKVCEGGGWYGIEPIPDYLNDHNACQRVIDGMDSQTGSQYVSELKKLLGLGYLLCDHELFLFSKATPRQKCEAILKAYGKWKDCKGRVL